MLILKIATFVRDLAGGVLSTAAVLGDFFLRYVLEPADGVLSFAAVLGDFFLRYVLEPADGVLSFAAVLRGGLWPPTPPLCRCAEYTIDQLL